MDRDDDDDMAAAAAIAHNPRYAKVVAMTDPAIRKAAEIHAEHTAKRTLKPSGSVRPVPSLDAPFSLSGVIRSTLAATWTTYHSHEHDVAGEVARLHGAPAAGVRVPDHVLDSLDAGLFRDVGYLHALRSDSVALRLGARVTTALVPTLSAVASWQSVAAPAPSAPLEPARAVIEAGITFTRQQLIDSTDAPAAFEDDLRDALRAAAGAVLDELVFGGPDDDEALGIVRAPGVVTRPSEIDRSALRRAQVDLAGEAHLAIVTSPALAERMATTRRVSDSDRMLWEGSSAAGTVEGLGGVSTDRAPSAVIIGNWSAVQLVQHPGSLLLEVEILPTGDACARLMIPVDVIVSRPDAFVVLTDVS